MYLAKTTICLVFFLLLQGCNNQEKLKEIEKDKKSQLELKEYKIIRKNLIKKKEKEIFGIGLGTSYKDLTILMNPALTGLNSALYEDDLAENTFPEFSKGINLTREKDLNLYTHSYLYKKDLKSIASDINFTRNDIIPNFVISAVKPSSPFQYYEAELSEKYGVCALVGHYYLRSESYNIPTKNASRAQFNNLVNKNIVGILDKKYKRISYFEVPDYNYSNQEADGAVEGVWENDKITIELNGGTWRDSSQNEHETLAIRYISKNSVCHEDVKSELEAYKTKQDIKNKRIENIEEKKRMENSSL